MLKAVSSTINTSGLTASTALALNANKEVVSVTNTGTGNNVLSTSPVLTTPNIGAATAGNPAAGIPLVAGAVEVLRFPAGSFFSGASSAPTTVYLTPGEGL